MPVRLPPFGFSWPPTCQWLLAFNRYLYNRCVFVFRGIPHGGVVLVSVICASFEETLAPVKQTLSAFRGCALLVRRRPSNVSDLFTRRFTSRTVLFLFTRSVFSMKLDLKSSERRLPLLLARVYRTWDWRRAARGDRSRGILDLVLSSIAIDTIR